MNDTAMIAYLPSRGDWCQQDLPHMTLVYCGKVADLQPGALSAISKDALSAAQLTGPMALAVTGVDTLGEDQEQVDALLLYPDPKLMQARKLVEKWNASQYKDFVPHATIGPVGSAFSQLPPVLYFDRLLVAWGEKQMIFPLGY